MNKKLKTPFIVLISGFLGCWAGSDGTTKGWRRVGMPTILIIATVYSLKWYSLLYAFLFAPLTLGYGRYDPTDDKPSFLGKLAYKLFKGYPTRQDVFIRFTVALLCWTSLCPIVIFKTGNWLLYGVLGVIYVINDVLWGACISGEGMFKMFGKELLWEEFIRFAVLGGLAYLIAIL